MFPVQLHPAVAQVVQHLAAMRCPLVGYAEVAALRILSQGELQALCHMVQAGDKGVVNAYRATLMDRSSKSLALRLASLVHVARRTGSLGGVGVPAVTGSAWDDVVVGHGRPSTAAPPGYWVPVPPSSLPGTPPPPPGMSPTGSAGGGGVPPLKGAPPPPGPGAVPTAAALRRDSPGIRYPSGGAWGGVSAAPPAAGTPPSASPHMVVGGGEAASLSRFLSRLHGRGDLDDAVFDAGRALVAANHAGILAAWRLLLQRVNDAETRLLEELDSLPATHHARAVADLKSHKASAEGDFRQVLQRLAEAQWGRGGVAPHHHAPHSSPPTAHSGLDWMQRQSPASSDRGEEEDWLRGGAGDTGAHPPQEGDASGAAWFSNLRTPPGVVGSAPSAGGAPAPWEGVGRGVEGGSSTLLSTASTAASVPVPAPPDAAHRIRTGEAAFPARAVHAIIQAHAAHLPGDAAPLLRAAAARQDPRLGQLCSAFEASEDEGALQADLAAFVRAEAAAQRASVQVAELMPQDGPTSGGEEEEEEEEGGDAAAGDVLPPSSGGVDEPQRPVAAGSLRRALEEVPFDEETVAAQHSELVSALHESGRLRGSGVTTLRRMWAEGHPTVRGAWRAALAGGGLRDLEESLLMLVARDRQEASSTPDHIAQVLRGLQGMGSLTAQQTSTLLGLMASASTQEEQAAQAKIRSALAQVGEEGSCEQQVISTLAGIADDLAPAMITEAMRSLSATSDLGSGAAGVGEAPPDRVSVREWLLQHITAQVRSGTLSDAQSAALTGLVTGDDERVWAAVEAFRCLSEEAGRGAGGARLSPQADLDDTLARLAEQAIVAASATAAV